MKKNLAKIIFNLWTIFMVNIELIMKMRVFKTNQSLFLSQ
jgi:hypothetical protein